MSAFAVLLVPSALWAGFCRAVSGHWPPNTAYLKTRSFTLGTEELERAWGALTEYGWAASPGFVFVLGGAALLVACMLGRGASGRAVSMAMLG